MKIAYFTNQYPKTSHSFVRREIAALEAQGFEVQRVSIRRVGETLVDAADEAERDQTTYLLDDKPGLFTAAAAIKLTRPARYLKALRTAWRLGGRSDRGRLMHGVYLMEACALARRLERDGVEHVHVHFGTNPASVMLLTHELTGIPFSVTCHGPEEFDKPYETSLGDKIAAAKFVVGVSSFGRSQLYRWCGLEHWPKVRVVHCGVAADYLEADPTPVPVNKRLVCIGRLCEQKGQLLLVQAAAALHERGEDFELVLVGDGDMRGEVERLIEQRGLQGKVTITGWQNGEQVRSQVAGSRAMVLPSFAEGLPVAIMEALALGRPVVSTYIAGIPELVDAGCGWVVPAGDVDALTEALADCLGAGPERLNAMGAVGVERVRAAHDVTREAATLGGLIREGVA